MEDFKRGFWTIMGMSAAVTVIAALDKFVGEKLKNETKEETDEE